MSNLHETKGLWDGKYQPRDYQRAAIEFAARTIASNPRLIIHGGVGCHAKGTTILMHDGSLKMVEDIIVGDQLMGPDGLPRVVKCLHRGNQTFYKITINKDEPIYCNEDHILALKMTPLISQSTFEKFKCRKSMIPKLSHQHINMSIKEYINKNNKFKRNTKMYYSSLLEFPEKELPIDPYILGLIIGDGYLRTKPWTCSITTMDHEISEYWCNYWNNLGFDIQVFTKKNNKASAYQLTTHHKGRNNALVDLVKNKFIDMDFESGKKHIPDIYKVNSSHNRLQLLAGIIDTDGYYYSGVYEITLKSKKLIDDIQYIARSLGLRTFYTPVKKSIKSIEFTGEYHKITISGNTSIIPCKLKRKQSTVTPNKDKLLSRFNVEKIEPQDYYGFDVDKDRLYVMGNFLVTHNCGKSFLIRTLQREFDGLIITPENMLVHQYVREYAPDLNYYIGQSNYKCLRNNGKTCNVSNKMYPCSHRAKNACPLTTSQTRFAVGDHTVTNVAMAWMNRDVIPYSKLRLVDEAHRVIGIIRTMTNQTVKVDKSYLKKSNISIHDLLSDIQFSHFLDYRMERATTEEQQQEISMLKFLMEEYPHELVREITPTGNLRYYTVKLNRKILSSIFGKSTVCLSGTLLPHDIEECFGENVEQYRIPPVIPVVNRPILFWGSGLRSHGFGEMDVEVLARHVARVIRTGEGRNTIVHTTYALGRDLVPLVRDLLGGGWRVFSYAESDGKQSALGDYIKAAGSGQKNVIIGGGLSEGVDLKGRLGELNIITKLMYPNKGDSFVEKRMSLIDGNSWYIYETLKVLLQSVGRTTRGVDDKSMTVVCDPGFPRFMVDVKGRRGLNLTDIFESLLFSDHPEKSIKDFFESADK